MAKLTIQGGSRISGTHRVPGNKNAALPMIAAALLTDEPVTLVNLPEIADVASMLEAARSLGATVTRQPKDRSVTITTPRLRTSTISADLAAKIRTSILSNSPIVETNAIRPITDNPEIDYFRFRSINENTEAIRDLVLGLPEIRHDAFAITTSNLGGKGNAC